MTTEEILAEVKAIVEKNSTDSYRGYEHYEADPEIQAAGYLCVEDSVIEDQGRWSVFKRSVYVKETTFVAVSWDDPATEMQNGQESTATVFEVVPEATVKYVKPPE